MARSEPADESAACTFAEHHAPAFQGHGRRWPCRLTWIEHSLAESA
jgi:hypothetical protein